MPINFYHIMLYSFTKLHETKFFSYICGVFGIYVKFEKVNVTVSVYT